MSGSLDRFARLHSGFLGQLNDSKPGMYSQAIFKGIWKTGKTSFSTIERGPFALWQMILSYDSGVCVGVESGRKVGVVSVADVVSGWDAGKEGENGGVEMVELNDGGRKEEEKKGKVEVRRQEAAIEAES
uniref:Uncharacterized protein n=1 Tax=Chenopodium quinoa TaxID=63459 RepID=A0A803MBX6_CHEQI